MITRRGQSCFGLTDAEVERLTHVGNRASRIDGQREENVAARREAVPRRGLPLPVVAYFTFGEADFVRRVSTT